MSWSPSVSVVLVRPKFSVNVGYASRAMANMGFGRMILVAPRCKIDQRACEGAAGGNGPLGNAITFSDWKTFYESEGAGIRIGFTRRMGSLRTIEPIRETLNQLWQSEQIRENPPHIYLVFGPEDHGLDAEDLNLMHHACYLPTYGEFGSMNLSHAVLIATHILRLSLEGVPDVVLAPEAPLHGGDRSSISPSEIRNTSEAQPLDFPKAVLDQWLIELGFDLESMKVNAGFKLTQMMMRAVPTPTELKLFQDILYQTIRKLRERKSSTPLNENVDLFDR